MSILRELEKLGFDTVPAEFYDMIDMWRSWYAGSVAKFHTYRVFVGNGKHVTCKRFSFGMGKKVAEDWASLLMNEKVKITLEGKKEQEFFDSVCAANNFAVKVNEAQEIKAATGTVAYIPRVTGVVVDQESGELISGESAKIKLDYVPAEDIYPISWENGIVIECAFASTKTLEGSKYVYLQIHRNTSGTYDIENRLYKIENDQMREIALSDVSVFSSVPAVIHTKSEKRQFVIDRLNIANNLDASLPMGVAAFANAIDQLKGVDIAYDSYVNEFVLGKKRIMVKPEATKNVDGEEVFDTADTVYYVLPEDSQMGTMIETIDMTLRTQEHNTGMQDMLNALSAKCGFGENHYRFNGGSVSTATQIISENSALFRNIKKHEIILGDALVELCRIILHLGNAYMNAGLNEGVEISIDFDDSIIEDEETNFNRDARMVSMGVMQLWEFRAKYMNEDPKTAKAALPQMEALVTE